MQFWSLQRLKPTKPNILYISAAPFSAAFFMEKKRKELIWLLSPLIVVVVVTLLCAAFGRVGMDDGIVKIYITRTGHGSSSFGMPPLYYLLLFTSLFGFFIFALRSAANRFKNASSNTWLLIYTLLLIVWLFFIMYALTQID